MTVNLHYDISGAGDPIVLLHGFATDLHLWDDQVQVLAPKYRVIRYDLRGFGRSPAGAEPYSHAGDLKSIVDQLGLSRVVLVGLSLGGGAAINFAIEHPDAVRALVLVDSTLGGFAWSQGFTTDQAAIRKAAIDTGVDAARAKWLSLPIFGPALQNSTSADRVRAQVGSYSGWHWLNPDPGRPFTPPAIQRLGAITAPTLIVLGERDTPDFHVIASTLEQGIAGAKKVTIPGAGHIANLEAPEKFNEILLGFLNTLA
ncbi:MAG: alpha/beta fold hydrolase [Acidobacteriia bacterium]|nr:alpha/beta fold hydrolase [Terriglobia bacterium]